MAALDGITVVDFTWTFPGALATMILADNGAEVIKVEPSAGDPMRNHPAFPMWHRGKKSVVLDLKTRDGQERAKTLVLQSDIVVEHFRPGKAKGLGLDYSQLAPQHPGLIWCSITGFGPKGPLANLKGYEGVVLAKAGVMWPAQGDRPRYAAVPGASFGAANGALQGILAALYVRGNTGKGQKVETSLVQGLTAYDLYNWLEPQLPPQFDRAKIKGGSIYPPISGGVGFTKDGKWLQLSNFLPHQRSAFLKAIGLEDYFREAMGKGEAPEAIQERVLRRLHEKTLDEWMEIFFQYDDIAVEPFRTTQEAMEHPQILHNGHIIDIENPELGHIKQLGPLVTMTKTPARVDRPAPALGEHNDATLFVAPAARVSGGAVAKDPAGPPLAGVTAVELGWFYAAPFGVALLADLGARVIKVENMDGDPHRRQNPLPEFAGVKGLQGKESIAVDLNKPEGQEILHRIIARADLVMRNFRQPNSEKMGVDYEGLARFNPDLVYLYAAAYGADGPYSARPAYAPTMGTAVGYRAYELGWREALKDGGPMTFEEGKHRLEAMRSIGGPGGTGNADAGAALGVGTAMLLGLVARQRTGQGQLMQTTMLCTNAYAMSDDFIAYERKPARVVPDKDLYGMGALYRLYQAKEGWVFLACLLPQEWEGLCKALHRATGGSVDLATDRRFTTPAERKVHDRELADQLATVFAERPAREWEQLLTAEDVACVEVSKEPLFSFTITHPVMRENGFVAEVEHPIFGKHLRHGPIVSLSMTPGQVGPGSRIGQHTRAILAELGYSEAQILDLKKKGVVTWPEDAE